MSDDEYQRLLKQFPERVNNYINWKKYFERLVQAGRRTGRSDIEIGDDIRNEMRGQLDDRTIRAHLPPSMKHREKQNLYLKHDADQDPHPPRERIVEIIPEPKVIETPIKALEPSSIQGHVIEVVFDPAPIDRDRTQVFIVEIDLATRKVVNYKTVGRRTVVEINK